MIALAKNFFVAVALLFPLATFASETLAIDQALQEGRANNPQYQRAQAAADAAAARSSEALAGYLPRVSVSGSHLLGYRFQLLNVAIGGGAPVEFPAIQPQTTLNLDLNWNLFDGFQTTHLYRAARLESSAADLEASHAALAIENDIRLKYYQTLSAQLLAQVADQNVKTLQDHLAKAQAILRGGGSTKLDALRVDVQLSEAMPEQAAARDNLALARMNLSQAMGLEHDDRPLSSALPEPDAGRLPANLTLNSTLREDLAALANRAEAAANAHLAAGSIWLPRIGFSAETQAYNNLDASVFSTANFRNAYTVAVGFSWNIFDLGQIARQRVAAAQQVQAERISQAANLRAPADFELWKRRFLTQVQLYKARTHAIESAQESVRLSHLSYEAGTRTSTEVLDTELDLFRARAGAVRAQLDAAESLINLELAVGHHL
jgi:outer membrane protein TolC